MLALLVSCLLAIATTSIVVSSNANAGIGWLGKVLRQADEVGDGAAGGRRLGGSIDDAASHLKRLPPKNGRHALAAAATQEGHWRFVNRDGDTFTAANKEELARAFDTLLPEGHSGAVNKVDLYISDDTIFKHPAALDDLPDGGRWHVISNRKQYSLVRQGEGEGARVFALMRGKLMVEMSDKRAFGEAIHQLSRRLPATSVHLLTLKPGGPRWLNTPAKDVAKVGSTTPRSVDPFALADALPALRGQTVLLTGRLEGKYLHFKHGVGAEGSVAVSEIRAAAKAADVNLVLLQTKSGRQPGTRNWFWQRAFVKGLDEVAGKIDTKADMASFLMNLAGPNSKLTVTIGTSPAERVRMTIAPAKTGLIRSTGGWQDKLAEVVSSLTGDVAGNLVELDLMSKEREQERKFEFIPGVSGDVHLAYLGLFVLGLVGAPFSIKWWRWIWPPEAREEYRNSGGYVSAKVVRWVLFGLIFMPLVAVVSAPVALLSPVYAIVVVILGILVSPIRWLFRSKTT